jgi:signal transduction histidine kinase
MDAVRQLTTELLARESAKVAASQAELDHTLRLARWGVLLLSALGLVSLFMYLRKASALDDQHEQQQRDELAHRGRLEQEVAQRTAQLTELATHLQTAREDERHRLARNLHDELGALLTSAKLDAARIRSRLTASGPPEALERLHHLVDALNSSIALGRRIIEDLRPSTLGNLGLVPTLEILARDFSTHSGVPVHCSLEPVRLTPDAQLVVYRLVQEAITNIAKYARAQQVWIELAPAEGQARIRVRDDGVGFDPQVQTRAAFGLMGMRHRVASQGGSFRLSAVPGQGTVIEVSLPEAAPVPAPTETVPER